MGNIKTETTKIIDSGSVISFNDEQIEIGFSVPGIENPRLLFSFNNDDEKDARVEFELIEDNSVLLLKLFNFNNSLDRGNRAPIRIGTTNEKELYLNYRVNKIGDSWTLMYTIYMKI